MPWLDPDVIIRINAWVLIGTEDRPALLVYGRMELAVGLAVDVHSNLSHCDGLSTILGQLRNHYLIIGGSRLCRQVLVWYQVTLSLFPDLDAKNSGSGRGLKEVRVRIGTESEAGRCPDWDVVQSGTWVGAGQDPQRDAVQSETESGLRQGSRLDRIRTETNSESGNIYRILQTVVEIP